MSVATSSAQAPLEALSGGDALIGMAALGKTAAALALVIAIILLCTSLLKRWQHHRYDHGTSSTPPRPPTRFSQRLANAIANSRGKGDSTSSDSQHTS